MNYNVRNSLMSQVFDLSDLICGPAVTAGAGQPCRNGYFQSWDSAGSSNPVFVISTDGNGTDWNKVAGAVGASLLGGATWDRGYPMLSMLASEPAVLILDCRGQQILAEEQYGWAVEWASAKAAALLVLIDMASVDDVYAAITDSNVTILCDPSELELCFVLRVALELRKGVPMLYEKTNLADDARLERLFEEFNRLSEMVQSLFEDATPQARSMTPSNMPVTNARSINRLDSAARATTPITSGQVRSLLRARRLRDQVLPCDLFADPAWDMMLDLMAAELERQRVSVSSLCIASAVPPTTALRWIKQLTERGLLERQDDDMDGRRVFISLTPKGRQAVERWFHEARDLLCDAAGKAN